MRIKRNELLREATLDGVESTEKRLMSLLEEEKIDIHDISLKAIAEALIVDKNTGKPIGAQLLNETASNGNVLTESSATAIDPSSFSTIFNQFLYNAMIPEYMNEDFAVANSFGVIQTQVQNGDLIPGISNLGDVAQKIGPGKEFPRMGVTQDYLRTRPLEKFGFLVGLEWESLIHDNTGLLLERAKNLGRYLGVNRENQACDVLIDATTAESDGNYTRWLGSDYRYNWRDTSYATYQSSTPWINVSTSNGLVNYTNINAAWLVLANQTDPFTGLPLVTPSSPLNLAVTQDNFYIAQHIKRSTQYVTGTSSSSSDRMYFAPEGAVADFEITMSKYLKQRLTHDGSRLASEYYMGHFRDAFKWMSFNDVVVEEEMVPGLQGVSFTHHLATQYRCYRYQSPICFQPRLVVKVTA